MSRLRRLVRGARAALRRTSIAARMALLVVLVVGVTTASIGALSYVRAREALEAAARVRLELLARDMARNLRAELAARRADVTTWARLDAMLALTYGDVDKELADLLHDAIALHASYQALAAFDVEGRPVAWAGDAAAVPARLRVEEGARLRVAPADDGPELVLETVVRNPRRPGETVGALAGFLSPARLLAAMAAGRDGPAPAVGVTVSARGTGVILRGGADAAGAADDAVEASARLAPLPGMVGPRLSVHVREPAAAAFAGVAALRRTLARIALAVLVVSVALGGLVAWRISQPIRRLTTAVQAIAARGRPEPVADLPAAGGEVGVLSAAFETMLERLAVAQREAIHQSRLALLGEVAASVAHDVRTPLSVLKTSAQLLAGGELGDAERSELAGMVAAEVDRLNRVVSGLVDLARPRPPRPAPVTVAELVESAVALLGPWARSLDVAIEMCPETPGLRVRADRDHIRQVVLNLLHNGVQAAARPGRVVIGWRADAGRGLIEVLDDGPGFTPEALERAFAPFFTTKPRGTGLGLAISKRIVEEQGGEVGAENRTGGGARVWVRLPLAEPPR